MTYLGLEIIKGRPTVGKHRYYNKFMIYEYLVTMLYVILTLLRSSVLNSIIFQVFGRGLSSVFFKDSVK